MIKGEEKPYFSGGFPTKLLGNNDKTYVNVEECLG